jgi:hypothetical protein
MVEILAIRGKSDRDEAQIKCEYWDTCGKCYSKMDENID